MNFSLPGCRTRTGPCRPSVWALARTREGRGRRPILRRLPGGLHAPRSNRLLEPTALLQRRKPVRRLLQGLSHWLKADSSPLRVSRRTRAASWPFLFRANHCNLLRLLQGPANKPRPNKALRLSGCHLIAHLLRASICPWRNSLHARPPGNPGPLSLPNPRANRRSSRKASNLSSLARQRRRFLPLPTHSPRLNSAPRHRHRLPSRCKKCRANLTQSLPNPNPAAKRPKNLTSIKSPARSTQLSCVNCAENENATGGVFVKPLPHGMNAYV